MLPIPRVVGQVCVGDMTHSYVRHDSFVYARRLVHKPVLPMYLCVCVSMCVYVCVIARASDVVLPRIE